MKHGAGGSSAAITEKDNDQKDRGKTAVITGGTEGIGLATGKLFVKEGAYVFISGRRQKELDAAVKAIGANVSGVQGDVAQFKRHDHAQMKTAETFAELEGAVQRSLGKTGLMMFLEFDQDCVLRKGDWARYCEDHAHSD